MSGPASLYERARRVTPGGVHSPVRAFRSVGGDPLFFTRGHGPTLVTQDGRELIDFCQSFGPLILGHHDETVARAAHQAIDDGWSFGACEPYSLALAEWIVAHVPHVDRVRFVSSGTEAVMTALRIARGATGRSRLLKFEGCYHGHVDSMLVRAGSGLAGRTAASSAGISDATLSETVVVPLDDDAALDRAFSEHGSSLAAVIVEPLPANHGLLRQRTEWLRRLASLCSSTGTLLIFDEVISGFRVGLTGMAGLTDITPDLTCYGKVIGGGFPVGACAGRAELMDLLAPIGPVYQAGTLSANPVGMRAGLATLTKVASLDGWRELERRAEAFADDLAARIAGLAEPPAIIRAGSVLWFHVSRQTPRRVDAIDSRQGAWFAKVFHAAVARGVYLPPSGFEVLFLSLAHDDACLDRAADAIAGAMIEAAA
ncbi:MAG TPA: glutamate-1-semialdehyde 2,1-aminomutase [Vicinamibacterales bacterium]|nr:glutamate-1-semialdehyde 2,1-aminomutase [Vicinamibacterales bacterium]